MLSPHRCGWTTTTGQNEFRLILQHGKGALTECSVQTLVDDIQLPNYFLAFGESETIGELIVLSESLRDAFSEIYSMYVSYSLILCLNVAHTNLHLLTDPSNIKCGLL